MKLLFFGFYGLVWTPTTYVRCMCSSHMCRSARIQDGGLCVWRKQETLITSKKMHFKHKNDTFGCFMILNHSKLIVDGKYYFLKIQDGRHGTKICQFTKFVTLAIHCNEDLVCSSWFLSFYGLLWTSTTSMRCMCLAHWY